MSRAVTAAASFGISFLEKSIAHLPDDTQASDAQWFGDELKRTEAELTTVTNRLTDIEVAAASARINQEEEKRADLVALY